MSGDVATLTSESASFSSALSCFLNTLVLGAMVLIFTLCLGSHAISLVTCRVHRARTGFGVCLLPLAICLFFLAVKYRLQRKRFRLSDKGKNTLLAFFHPYWSVPARCPRPSCQSHALYSNDGGGGERVLWCGIRAIQEKKDESVQVYVYTGHTAPDEAILERAKVLSPFLCTPLSHNASSVTHTLT